MKHILKLISFLKPYRREAVLSLVLLALVVVLDLAIPRLVQHIIDQGVSQKNMQVVFNTGLLMLGISALNTLMAIGNNYYSILAAESFGRDLREALFVKIQSFSFGNLDQLRTGDLMVRLTSDLSTVQRVVQMSLRIGTRAPLLLVGSLVLMLVSDLRLTLIALPLLLLTGAVIVFFVSRLAPMFLAMQQKLDDLNSVLQENLSGIRVVKAFVRDEYENKRFSGVNEGYTEQAVKMMQFISTFFPVLMLLMNGGVVLIIWLGGLQVIAGELSLGGIVAFTNYLMTAMFPLSIMGMLSTMVAWGDASSERINGVLDTLPEIQQSGSEQRLPQHIQGRVEFEDVCFDYNGSCDELILKDISLLAEPGQTLAILGATGAGKTTLVNLIPRFYDVVKGRVMIDGIDVRHIKQESLLSHIGVVLQESVLFSGTIRDNIRYGYVGADEEQVQAAAKAAQAHEFIMEFPQGYDTQVEARGVNLSGGQKQRIAIARALLMQPEILILDDSTSSVDVETETKIQEALERAMQGKTIFIVAQRISTVLKADKIIVIDKGCIAAQGTHEELMRSSPIYQEIYDSQLGDGFNGNGHRNQVRAIT